MEEEKKKYFFRIMATILPGILFLAARSLEKLFFVGLEKEAFFKSSLSGAWFAFVLESVILLVLVCFRIRQDGGKRILPFRRLVYNLLIGIAIGMLAGFVNRMLGLIIPVALSVPKMLTLCAVGPISEEIVYRGFVLERCRNIFSAPVSIIVSSLLFAVAHGNIWQVTEAFLVGLIFGIMVYKTEDVKDSCFTHAVANAVIYLVFFYI